MNTPRPCNVLMLYPRFVADSFWSFTESCKLMGVRRSAAPLGLISVAAMLPGSWMVRLVDCNTAAISDDDLAWADVVFTGGQALYEHKRDRHANVHAFPSSVDTGHFARARVRQPDPEDQSCIPHPRLGFFGGLPKLSL